MAFEQKDQGTDEPMFIIAPSGLYSAGALASALSGMMTLETFLTRAKPKKRFKSAWFGQDLIDAVAAMPSIGEEDEPPPAPIVIASGSSRRGPRGARSGPGRIDTKYL